MTAEILMSPNKQRFDLQFILPVAVCALLLMSHHCFVTLQSLIWQD